MSNYAIASSSASPGVNANSAAAASSPSGLDSDQFMLLLLAQLRNQNPLEPMEDKDVMAQITQMNSLTELQKINAGVEALNQSNQLTEAAGLIGKSVEVKLNDGNTQKGTVTGVSLTQGEIMLWLGDQTVPLSGLVTVSTPASMGVTGNE
jgi:flagellar basal-body rod modification protein FlgD